MSTQHGQPWPTQPRNLNQVQQVPACNRKSLPCSTCAFTFTAVNSDTRPKFHAGWMTCPSLHKQATTDHLRVIYQMMICAE